MQVTALSTVEAKKRFEFLEAVSGTMDAHLRYFKQVDNGSHSREFLPFSYVMTDLCLSLIFSFVATCRGMSCCTKWSHTLIRFVIYFWKQMC